MTNKQPRRIETYRANRKYYHEAPRRPERTGHPVFLAAPLFGAAVIFLILFAWQWQGYRRSAQEYDTLREQLSWVQATPESGMLSRLDFAALQARNPDTSAWLEMPGLDLSLPVMQSEDSTYYLRRNFDGEYSNSGSLIRPSWDEGSWADGLCHVIHGHNIHDGSMFGSLDRYRDADFCAQNPTFTLYTPDGDFLCTVFSAHEALATDDCYRLDFQPGEDYQAFLEDLKNLSFYDTGTELQPDSRVLTLSTCRSSYASNNQRFVVHAVMTPLP